MSKFVNYLDQIKKQKEFTYSHATDFFFQTNYYYSTYYMNRPAVTNNEMANQYPDYSLFTQSAQLPCIYPSNLLQKPNNIWKVTNNNTIVKKPKQYVNIEDKINSIEDILSILDKYKFDTEIEYNIDLLSMYMIQAELRELNKMIGMKSLKESVLNQLLYFMQDLHLGKEGDYKHTVISGPPGTGKTEIAKVMGKMYSKLGVLKKNVFKKVTRNDLVAGYLGQTALKTKGVINDCLGGVLFIDEAYSLGTKENGDSYAYECIDIICESLSDHKDDLMVIIAGYKDELNDNFFAMNKGLSSRFVWRFHIDNYTATELREILLQKISDSGWNLDENANLTVQWFEKNFKNFKNYGRDMELLFFYAKISHGKRIFGKDKDMRKKITLDDIENGYKLFLENKQSKETHEIFGLYV
jgi:SpoVK/Ycf46/Vps4 family AAA+-type ATPase